MMRQAIRQIQHSDAGRILHCTGVNFPGHVTGSTFLQALHDHSGLLLENEDQSYAFSHLSFQEYLAAVYATTRDRSPYVIKHTDNPWWRQTLVFLAALGDADA